MKRNNVTGLKQDVATKVTEAIVAALESGVAPWAKPWKSDGTASPLGMPTNYATARAYRGINILLLWAAGLERGFKDTRWLTFKQALDMGGHVKKGEKGTHVVLWKTGTRTEEGEDGEETTKKTLYAREYVVFNVEQCEGFQLEKLDSGKPADVDAVLALVSEAGAVVVHGGNRAAYMPAMDIITMPHQDTFTDVGAYQSILLHEAGHWTGHPSRKARDFSGRFGSEAYAFEELVAELTSAMTCAHLGVQGRLQHVEYIGNWLKVLKGDKHAIFTAARLAQEAAEYLLGTARQEEAEESAGVAA